MKRGGVGLVGVGPDSFSWITRADRSLPSAARRFMLFRVAEYCAWSSLTPLHSTESYRRWGIRAEGKDIWWKCGVWILGETEGGEARFWGFGGELGTGGKAVSEGWFARLWLGTRQG